MSSTHTNSLVDFKVNKQLIDEKDTYFGDEILHSDHTIFVCCIYWSPKSRNSPFQIIRYGIDMHDFVEMDDFRWLDELYFSKNIQKSTRYGLL